MSWLIYGHFFFFEKTQITFQITSDFFHTIIHMKWYDLWAFLLIVFFSGTRSGPVTYIQSDFAQCILLWNSFYLSSTHYYINRVRWLLIAKTRSWLDRSFVKWGKQFENEFVCKRQQKKYLFVAWNNIKFSQEICSLLFHNHAKAYL